MALTETRPSAAGVTSPPQTSGSDARVRGPRMSTVFTSVFALGGLALGVRQLHDNSFLWHMRTGELILDRGIPHSDPYSFTAPGTKWIAQSWLAELLYG